jgi:ankyrin repeat protein/DNA-binding response OmpR family regulator
MKILIVDDDTDIHDLMALELKKQGHEIFQATSSIEAIDLLREEYIDLIFLDIVLKGNETSQSVVEYIYGDENKINSHIPIILMSAHMNEEYEESVKHAKTKIHATMRKPFDKETLKLQIDSLRYRDVLVLDDDDDILDLMSTALIKKNFRVIRVKTSEEALKAINTHRLICCFLDIVLENNTSSEDVFKKIDEMKTEKGIALPVIVMSAHITDELRNQMENSQIEIHSILEKPFTSKKIGEMVEEIEIKVSSRTQIDGGFVDTVTTQKVKSNNVIDFDKTIVKGSKQEKEDAKFIKGDGSKEVDEAQVVKGSGGQTEENDDFTRVKGSGSENEEREDFTRVKGKGSEEEGTLLTTSSTANDENEDYTRVKGKFDGEAVKDSMLVKGGGVEEKDQFTRVKGNGASSSDDEQMNLIKGEKEDLSTTMTAKGDAKAADTTSDVMKVKGDNSAADVTPDAMTIKGDSTVNDDTSDVMKVKGDASAVDATPEAMKVKGDASAVDATPEALKVKGDASAADATPEAMKVKGDQTAADVTEEKQIVKGDPTAADESKRPALLAGEEGSEPNKVENNDTESIKQYQEKINENEVMGSVKTSMEHNEIAGKDFKGKMQEEGLEESDTKMGFEKNNKTNSESSYEMKDGVAESYTDDIEEHGQEKTEVNLKLSDSAKQKLAKQMEHFKKRSINDRNENGMTSLMVAARYGQVASCRELVSQGAEASLKSKNGKTALHYAVMSLNLPTVHYFLELGTRVNVRDDKNVEPLYEAIALGNHQMASYLIEKGARTNARHNGQTYLMIAAQRGDLEIFKLLLESGMRIEQRDFKGKTAIDYAKIKKKRNILLYVKEMLAEQKKASS